MTTTKLLYSIFVLSSLNSILICCGLFLGFFNLETSYGHLTRSIEGTLLKTFPNSDTLGTNIVKIDPAKYGAELGEVDFGKYERDLLVVRPSFGSGEEFQLGFTYLHSKDDYNSIEFGPNPQENLVLGTDLYTSADNKRSRLTADAAVNVTNTDISTGTLTDEQIDSIFVDDNLFNADPDDVKNIKDIIGRFITVNQFLTPLNPQKFSSVAAEAEQLSWPSTRPLSSP